MKTTFGSEPPRLRQWGYQVEDSLQARVAFDIFDLVPPYQGNGRF